MIVAFDLDDTLYRELDFVESGFRAVAAFLEDHHGVPRAATLQRIDESLHEHGRGRQFDDALLGAGLYSSRRRDQLVQVYRQHAAELQLPAESADVLDQLRTAGHRLFLVTDGNHRVQHRKAEALGLLPHFEHCYFTNRYGRASAKPSTRVFELMLRRTGASASDLVYIGDNPRKDFVGVRRLGGRTVRVRTGPYGCEAPAEGHGADVEIDRLAEAVDIVESWAR